MPVVLQGESVIEAKRVEFATGQFNERWLQEHLFARPSLIPFEELEPACKGSVAVAMEVGVRTGSIDLLYVSPDGHLTVAETKLWRNPEARRVVVSQLIDYAAELARLTYESLVDALRESTDEEGDPLLASLAKAGVAVDEKRFHDAVTRNLRLGRFLLLAVGDGIQEGVEAMSEYLQGQPHLGFALRLVEMAVFELGGDLTGTLLIQPRVVARTREVVRAVIRFEGEARVEVSTPPAAEEASAGRSPITEAEFFRRLEEESSREEVEFVRRVLRQAPDHGLAVDWKQSGPLLKYVDAGRDTFFTLGGFNVWTEFDHTDRFFRRCEEYEIPDVVWTDYFDALVRLIPHSRRRRFHPKSGDEWEKVVFDDDSEPIRALIAGEEAWWGVMAKAIQAVRVA